MPVADFEHGVKYERSCKLNFHIWHVITQTKVEGTGDPSNSDEYFMGNLYTG